MGGFVDTGASALGLGFEVVRGAAGREAALDGDGGRAAGSATSDVGKGFTTGAGSDTTDGVLAGSGAGAGLALAARAAVCSNGGSTALAAAPPVSSFEPRETTAAPPATSSTAAAANPKPVHDRLATPGI